jgi:deoxyadenosine/deoxycytidine kinase
MSKLVVIVGNSGVGKSTLARRLGQQAGFVLGLEQIQERPFQAAFARKHTRYALANQVDYLLLRAEQERTIRQQEAIGIQDGGLELDFYLFTHRFHQLGYLNEAEFALCDRLYHALRQGLPPPDLIIHLVAPLSVIAKRYQQRNRPLEIAQLTDLAALEQLLNTWLASVQTRPILTVDVSEEDPTYANVLPTLLEQIHERLGA